MNAPIRTPYAEQELHLLTLAKWARQSEEATLRRLYGTFDAPQIDEGECGDGGLPPLAPRDDEYSTAADLGREE